MELDPEEVAHSDIAFMVCSAFLEIIVNNWFIVSILIPKVCLAMWQTSSTVVRSQRWSNRRRSRRTQLRWLGRSWRFVQVTLKSLLSWFIYPLAITNSLCEFPFLLLAKDETCKEKTYNKALFETTPSALDSASGSDKAHTPSTRNIVKTIWSRSRGFEKGLSNINLQFSKKSSQYTPDGQTT